MSYEVMTHEDLNDWLEHHEGWRNENGQIVADFKFKDFKQAMVFINKVADLADDLGHHPTIENTYNAVRLSMNTHDAAGQITDKDVKLAEAINKVKDDVHG